MDSPANMNSSLPAADGDKGRLLLCLGATLALLGAPFPDGVKAALLPLLWYATLRPIAKSEVVELVAVDVLFTCMDRMAVSAGVFSFAHPQWDGLPSWEPLMWGFYLCWARRFAGAPRRLSRSAVALAVVFAAPFSLIAEPYRLSLVSGASLILMLGFFHDRSDLRHLLTLLSVGTMVECMGVLTHQWSYPGGGIPAWYAMLWGGVGLLNGRFGVTAVLNGSAMLGVDGGEDGGYSNRRGRYRDEVDKRVSLLRPSG